MNKQEEQIAEEFTEETVAATNFTYLNEKGKEKVSITNVVNALLFKYEFKTVYGTKSETIYYFTGGIWENTGATVIKVTTEKLLEGYCKNNIVQEVLGKIKRKTEIDYNKFNTIPNNLLCINNGIINLDNGEFMEHNSKYYFQSKFDIDYIPKADCPKIKEFIEETFYPEHIPLIQEWLGYIPYRNHFKKKAMIIFGDKNTGKTVFLNIVTKFVGLHNLAGLSLHQIAAGDKFALRFLHNKYVNLYDDLSSEDLGCGGGFKMATGGGLITGEIKFGDMFQFFTFAKNMFATNEIPPVNEIDDMAYYLRWLPIPCDNIVEKEDQNEFLIDELTTPEEMSGLLNWALEGLKRLLENKKFTYDKNVDEIKAIMIRHSNPIMEFIQDCIYEKAENNVDKTTMFEYYTHFCKIRNKMRLSKRQLSIHLVKHTKYILDLHDSKKRYWKNVDLCVNCDIYDAFQKSIRDKNKKL